MQAPVVVEGTPVATVNEVRVRLTKKLANRIDGVDLCAHRVGDIMDLPPQEARLLLAEDWAVDRERRGESRRVEVDRRQHSRRSSHSDDEPFRSQQ